MDQPRVRQGVPTGGRYAAIERTEPDVGLPPHLADLTPVDVDTALSGLYEQHHHALTALARLRDSIAYSAKLARMSTQEYVDSHPQDRTVARVAQLSRQADDLRDQMAVYNEEFERRGGWARAFLVTGQTGHVHSSMGCSTCNRDGKPTRFHWVTEYSGTDEDTIVGAAGERACTVCYPSAPVEVLSRPTTMFTPDELVAAQERADRAAAAQRRRDDRIAKGLTPDGSPLELEWTDRDHTKFDRTRQRYVSCPVVKHESFQTEKAAIMWWTDQWAQHSGKGHPRPAMDAIFEAIAAKHGRPVADVQRELEAKAAEKLRRRGY